MDNQTKLESLAVRVKGMKPNDPKAEAILDSADWTGFWPVTLNGVFTGGICKASDSPYGGPETGYELSADLMYAEQRFE